MPLQKSTSFTPLPAMHIWTIMVTVLYWLPASFSYQQQCRHLRVNFLLSYLIISGSINLDHHLPNFKVIWIFAPKQFFISWWSWYNFSKGFCTAGCPPDAPRRYCNVTAAARKKFYHLVWYIMDWLIISHCCSKTTPRLRQILRQMCGLWKGEKDKKL